MDSSADKSEDETQEEASNTSKLYDDSYENEIILNKRTFHLNLLDKTDVNER